MSQSRIDEYKDLTQFDAGDLDLLHMLSNRVKSISLEGDYFLFDFGSGSFVDREIGASKIKCPVQDAVLAKFVIDAIASEKHGAISLKDAGAIEMIIEDERSELGDLKDAKVIDGGRRGVTFMRLGFEYKHSNMDLNITEIFECYIEAVQVGLADKLAKQIQKD